jgi:3-hydroxyisobutyrate dehydrogenase
MQVAVLGTGIMGAGMARSLLRAGHSVRVWNRTGAKAERLAADGAVVADTAAAAVQGAEVVLVMLFDTAAVLDVLAAASERAGDSDRAKDSAGAGGSEGANDSEGAKDSEGAGGSERAGGSEGAGGAVWLQASTIGQAGMTEVAALAAGRGLRLVDAPVMGTKGPAEQGKLVSLLSGDEAYVRAARPAIDAYSARTVYAGPALGAASALKLVCNAWISTVNAAVGQSFALAQGLGLDPALFVEAISGGAADNQYLRMKSDMIAKGDYPPSFTLDGAVKDVELILAAARAAQVGDDVLAGLATAYRRASEAGHGEEDMGAVYHAFPPR